MLFSAGGYSLGGTSIEALYFARFGTDFLPYLYMGLGLLSLLTTLTITGLLGRIRRERMYVFVPFAASGFILIAWGLLFIHNPVVYPALWLGKESLNTIASIIAWNAAGAACDSRQAKRLFPLFNAARILGSVLGGLSTGPLINLIGAQNLVLVWAASMLVTFYFTQLLMKTSSLAEPLKKKSRSKRRQASFFQEMQKGWQFVRKSELLRWISVASILFSILYFSIALPFSKSAASRYPDENALASFLGLFNGLSTAAAFLASLLLANRLFARYGIMSMMLVFCLTYLFGFGALIQFNFFAVIVVFRFVQTLWLSGIADSAWQTMFSAVPPEKRDQINAFINGVPEQAGAFLAGTILLVGEQSFTPQQLYLVGFVTAIAAALVIWRASSAYRRALVDTLREGRPTLFDQPRGASTDATTIAILIEHLGHRDPLIRRLAADMLAETSRADALIYSLHDNDVDVRVAALKGLTRVPAAAASILPLLFDPEPAARTRAIRTLRVLSVPVTNVEDLLKDSNTYVQIEAALSLLSLGEHPLAREFLRQTAVFGNLEERKAALNAMAERGDRDAFVFIANEIRDLGAPASIRRAAALALAACGPEAIPPLIDALADEDTSVVEGAAFALAQVGDESILPLVTALRDRSRAEGALIALGQISSASRYASDLRIFAAHQIESAIKYDELAHIIHIPSPSPEGLAETDTNSLREKSDFPSINRIALLQDSLHARAIKDGIKALRAIALFSDRESIRIAIENLQGRAAAQSANALETLESVRESRLIRPLFRLWESTESPIRNFVLAQETIQNLLLESDGWIRACAAFALSGHSANPTIQSLAETDPLIRNFWKQGEPMNTRSALPIMERVILLRRVPLFADLTPSDLQRLASLATEHQIEADEVLFAQGDLGEEMFVIVDGVVRIMVGNDGTEKEFARRGLGEVIGEMALLSGDTRTATVIAATATHLICLDRKKFEGLLRERSDVALAVMRVLCMRLKEATR